MTTTVTILLLLFFLTLTISAIRDLLSRTSRYNTRVFWAIVILFLFPIGTFIYFLFRKNDSMY
ncbi:PLDc N-terminal domain-containing protein [Prolixibacter bellariivorans]|uniref:PLDc N-terminal domain-containing protein n=1 Tax=Prolixibacter bellariivorans TaxID=314319 RepID=UPI0009DF324B|nr:PLDc N-terminal domain-containing protein [Prolixibacter bellariivorans]